MVHGDALALVDRRRIAVVDVGVVLQIEPDIAPRAEQWVGPLETDGKTCASAAVGFDPLHRPEGPVLHPHRALVAQEHHPVSSREGALAPLGLQQVVGA